MRWPWAREREPETRTRETRSYTDLLLAAAQVRAEGRRSYDPASTAAVEVAAGLWALALMSAEVEGDARARAAVTPSFLALAARNWIRRGEDLHAVRVSRDGRLSLLPSPSWTVTGGADPETWSYRVLLAAPSSSTLLTIPRAGVVHSLYAAEPEAPWRGSPPWRFASLSADLLAALERRLGQEAGGPVGQVVALPLPPAEDDEDEDPLVGLQRTINALDGGLALMETTAGGMGLGPAEAPRQDWRPQRIGASPPAPLVTLRGDAAEAIIQAAGIPFALVADRDGTALRESWRRFIVGAVEARARELARVVSEALETDVRFSFRRTWAHDLVGRTSAFKTLVDAGMSTEDALRHSGLGDV